MSRRVSIVLSFWVFVSWAPAASAETAVCPKAFADLESPLHLLKADIAKGPKPASVQHRLKIKEGRGYIRIGYLTLDDPRFLKLLVSAVKQGQIAELNAGQIDGPKVLHFILRLQESVPAGQTMKIKGQLSISHILRRQMAEAASPEQDHTKGTRWTAFDIQDFKTAIVRLKIEEACKRLWKQADLSKCEVMRFEMNSNAIDEIAWKWRSLRGP